MVSLHCILCLSSVQYSYRILEVSLSQLAKRQHIHVSEDIYLPYFLIMHVCFRQWSITATAPHYETLSASCVYTSMLKINLCAIYIIIIVLAFSYYIPHYGLYIGYSTLMRVRIFLWLIIGKVKCS